MALAGLGSPPGAGSSGPGEGDPGLPRHWARDFYLAHVCLDAQENDEALGRLQVLYIVFVPTCRVISPAALLQEIMKLESIVVLDYQGQKVCPGHDLDISYHTFAATRLW